MTQSITGGCFFLQPKVFRELRERIVRNFLDIAVLAELKKGHLMSGYDVIGFLNDKFHLMMSSGTVYNTLYALEREGVIEGQPMGKRRVYKLTDKGEEMIDTILSSYEQIENVVASLCK